MAWGGWGGGGGMFGGRATAPGLPFGGIPSELMEGATQILKTEPEHGEPTARFSYQMTAAEHRSTRRPTLPSRSGRTRRSDND